MAAAVTQWLRFRRDVDARAQAVRIARSVAAEGDALIVAHDTGSLSALQWLRRVAVADSAGARRQRNEALSAAVGEAHALLFERIRIVEMTRITEPDRVLWVGHAGTFSHTDVGQPSESFFFPILSGPPSPMPDDVSRMRATEDLVDIGRVFFSPDCMMVPQLLRALRWTTVESRHAVIALFSMLLRIAISDEHRCLTGSPDRGAVGTSSPGLEIKATIRLSSLIEELLSPTSRGGTLEGDNWQRGDSAGAGTEYGGLDAGAVTSSDAEEPTPPIRVWRPLASFLRARPELLVALVKECRDVEGATAACGVLTAVARVCWSVVHLSSVGTIPVENDDCFGLLEMVLLHDNVRAPLRLLEAIKRSTSFLGTASMFGALRELLIADQRLSRRLLLEKFEAVFGALNALLRQPTATHYLAKRLTLTLIFDLLSDPAFVRPMLRYVDDSENFELIVSCMMEPSIPLAYEAFHVFKIFVKNPKKSAALAVTLARHRNQLLLFLHGFQLERAACDKQFEAERQAVALLVRQA
eukprot:Polyplicarium_translucidae@DN3195_c0_g1_i1.p1